MKLISHQLEFNTKSVTEEFFGFEEKYIIFILDYFTLLLRAVGSDYNDVILSSGIVPPFNVMVGKVKDDLVFGINNSKAIRGASSLFCLSNESDGIETCKEIMDRNFRIQIGGGLESYFTIDIVIIEKLISFFDYIDKNNINIHNGYNQFLNDSSIVKDEKDNVKANRIILTTLAIVYLYQLIEKSDKKMNINPVFKATNLSIDENLIFCALAFNEVRLEIFNDVLKPKIEERFGMNVIKAGEIYGPNLNIMETIWTYINQARIVIVDISDKNPNVFYELGICHTLGKQVIMICDQESLDKDYSGKLPFDLSSINTIFYKNAGNGMERLVNEISLNIQSVLENRHILK